MWTTWKWSHTLQRSWITHQSQARSTSTSAPRSLSLLSSEADLGTHHTLFPLDIMSWRLLSSPWPTRLSLPLMIKNGVDSSSRVNPEREVKGCKFLSKRDDRNTFAVPRDLVDRVDLSARVIRAGRWIRWWWWVLRSECDVGVASGIINKQQQDRVVVEKGWRDLLMKSHHVMSYFLSSLHLNDSY